MSNLKKLLVIFSLLVLVVPLTADAFWPFSSNKNKNQTETKALVLKNETKKTPELSAAARLLADSKYKLWEDGFEKKDIDFLIANKNNFWFTISEITYLFNKENEQAKNPFLKNLKLSANDNILKAEAEFKKFIKGRVSFYANLKKDNNKLKLELNKVRFSGIPVPATWASNPLNEALDNYFNFLYQDDRYQGFDFSINDNIIKLDLKFSQ